MHLTTEQRQQFERGIKAATAATQLEPNKPEGHFWLAADMGAMAEGFGLRNGIRYRGPIKTALETVLKLDPGFQQGSADRALGRWYFRVPRLFGGSKDKGIEHLKASLVHAPQSTATHFFLAEQYLDMDKKDDARREAQAVLGLQRRVLVLQAVGVGRAQRRRAGEEDQPRLEQPGQQAQAEVDLRDGQDEREHGGPQPSDPGAIAGVSRRRAAPPHRRCARPRGASRGSSPR